MFNVGGGTDWYDFGGEDEDVPATVVEQTSLRRGCGTGAAHSADYPKRVHNLGSGSKIAGIDPHSEDHAIWLLASGVGWGELTELHKKTLPWEDVRPR